MRNILDPVDISNLIELLDFRREASMEAEYFVLNDGREREIHKDFSEKFPDRFCAIFSKALIVEPIQSINFSIFMIAPQDSDATPMFDFKNEDIQECLHTMEAPVDIIAHEKIIGILGQKKAYWQLATDLEYLHEIMKLAMDIAADSHRCPDQHHIGFFHEYLFNLRYELNSTFQHICLTSFYGIVSIFCSIYKYLSIFFCSLFLIFYWNIQCNLLISGFIICNI